MHNETKLHFYILLFLFIIFLTSDLYAGSLPPEIIGIEYLSKKDIPKSPNGFVTKDIMKKLEAEPQKMMRLPSGISSKAFPTISRTKNSEPELDEVVQKIRQYIKDGEGQAPSSNYHPHRKGFKWVPTGAQEDPTSINCHPKDFEQQIIQFPGTEREKINHIKRYIHTCKGELSRNNYGSLFSLVRQPEIKYDFFDKPEIRPIGIKFMDGKQSVAFVAIKDEKPRPWIVVKCGLFCDPNPGSTSVKVMMMQVYDQTPFNIVFVGNHTGMENIRTNGRVSIGGFYEGQELMAIGKYLKYYSKWRHTITSLHLMGVSLGGNAALYASMYNDLNPISDDEKIFNSIMAYCPVVDTKETVDKIFKPNLKGLLFSLLTWFNIKDVYPSVPDFKDLFHPKDNRPKSEEFPLILGEAATRYTASLDPSEFLFPFHNNVTINSREDFWNYNNFLNYFQHVKTPTFVWGNKNDWVVNNEVNGGALEKALLNNSNPNINIYNMDKGNHCGGALVYGWETISSIMRGYFLSHSGEFSIEKSLKKSRVRLPSPKLAKKEIHVDQEWTVGKGKSYFQLTYKTWHPQRGGHTCIRRAGSRPPYRRVIRNTKPFTSQRSCYVEKKYKIPFNHLPMKVPFKPNSTTEAQALTRWANSNIEIYGASGRLINTKEPPKYLKWTP